MTPVLWTAPRTLEPASAGLRLASRIVRDAAKALAAEARETSEAARYLMVADRITKIVDSPRTSRQQLVLASPALTERSGRRRSLIEMIEEDPGDDGYRLRLAKILFRALIWRPETFPIPPR